MKLDRVDVTIKVSDSKDPNVAFDATFDMCSREKMINAPFVGPMIKALEDMTEEDVVQLGEFGKSMLVDDPTRMKIDDIKAIFKTLDDDARTYVFEELVEMMS